MANSGSTRTLALLAVALACLSVSAARNRIWHDEASAWKDVFKKSPFKARGYNDLGFHYFNSGRFDEAIECFEAALKLNRGYAKGYCNIGAVYLKKGAVEAAIEYLDRAVALDPDMRIAHYNLGLAHASQGRDAVARDHFSRACELGHEKACAALRQQE